MCDQLEVYVLGYYGNNSVSILNIDGVTSKDERIVLPMYMPTRNMFILGKSAFELILLENLLIKIRIDYFSL